MSYKLSDLTDKAAVQNALVIEDAALRSVVRIINGMMYMPLDLEVIQAIQRYRDLRVENEPGSPFSSEMINLFRYARGDGGDVYAAQEFRIELAHKLFLSVHDEMVNGGHIPVDWAGVPLVRFAVRATEARMHLDEDKYPMNLDPEEIAVLADLSYGRVMQLIRSGAIPAKKERGRYEVTQAEARMFLWSRWSGGEKNAGQ